MVWPFVSTPYVFFFKASMDTDRVMMLWECDGTINRFIGFVVKGKVRSICAVNINPTLPWSVYG